MTDVSVGVEQRLQAWQHRRTVERNRPNCDVRVQKCVQTILSKSRWLECALIAGLVA
jgi:hypothetical protein